MKDLPKALTSTVIMPLPLALMAVATNACSQQLRQPKPLSRLSEIAFVVQQPLTCQPLERKYPAGRTHV